MPWFDIPGRASAATPIVFGHWAALGALVDGLPGQVGAHIGFDEGPLGLRFGGAYAWHDIDASRTVAFPGFTGAPEGSYDATTRQLFGEASYNIAYGPASVAPFARLASIRTSTDGFEESDGEAALTLDRDVRDVQLLSLGVRASTVSAISETATIEPRAASSRSSRSRRRSSIVKHSYRMEVGTSSGCGRRALPA